MSGPDAHGTPVASVPPWSSARFVAGDDCVLFAFSDRPVHEALGWHREEFLD